MNAMNSLLKKYDLPVPRYTSYPTVPYWDAAPNQEQWISHIADSLNSSDSSWSIYIHIPYCESLCTFCGCNNIITKNHNHEIAYADKILKEWTLYKEKIPQLLSKPLKQIHLGGGTPTFLSAESLKYLLEPIMNSVLKTEDFEGSIEVDPRRTNEDQLKALKELGFNRVSMGVQDFHPEVQRLINRIQPYEITRDLTLAARNLGYTSVNYDLIYGLARQTPETFKHTVEKTLELSPDRIALYSFALVPWIKPAQRLFKDEDLPSAEEKRALYEMARNQLLANGYIEVGMDHFAKENENLALSLKNKKLHRNFMGYTDQKTDVLLGLGVSAISETPHSFHQNEKVIAMYEARLVKNEIPTFRGHVLNAEDKIRRQQILDLMTKYEVTFVSEQQKLDAEHYLAAMIQDELIEIKQNTLTMTVKGRPFLRNACVFFDERLKNKQAPEKLFSKSI